MNFVQESLAQLQALYSLGKKISIIGPAKRASVVRTMLLEKMVEKIVFIEKIHALSFFPNYMVIVILWKKPDKNLVLCQDITASYLSLSILLLLI